MNEKKSKSLFITIGVAAAIISLCAVLFGSLLAYATKTPDDIVQTDPAKSDMNLLAAESNTFNGLNIIVYNSGKTPPEDGVSGQFATAKAAEIAGRVYGLTFTGRVFVQLGKYFDYKSDDLYWYVNAQTNNGAFICAINATTGVDLQAWHVGEENDWTWFDNWNEKDADAERQKAEESMQTWLNNEKEAQSHLTPEEAAKKAEEGRQSILAFAAQNAGLPQNAKAVELANSLDIGNGAKAISGQIVHKYENGAEAVFIVDVKLDNGKYLRFEMNETTGDLLKYERFDTDYAQTMYG